MVTGTLRSVALSLDEAGDTRFTALLAFWREAKSSAQRLRIADLRPERFAVALPHVAVIQHVRGPQAGLRIRLCGGDIENKDFGLVRGAMLEDVKPVWYRDHLVPAVAAAMRSDTPVYHRVEITLHETSHHFLRLSLPLSTDGQTADAVLIAAIRHSNRFVSEMRAVLALA